MFRAKVYVTLKKSVMDPQGETIRSALGSLGYEGIDKVRIGKFLEVDVARSTRQEAEGQVDEMCSRLLSNPVIEQYRFELEELK